MPNFHRNRVPGGTYFFTVNLLDRSASLLIDHIAELRNVVRKTKSRKPFHIDAWVVLPEHMHCVWTLPDGDADFAGRWWLIKMAFSKALPIVEPRSHVMIRRRVRGIWQPRYWEHTIRDEADYAAHLDYTHFNPVKHGYVEHPGDWPYSSFRHCVAKGVYPGDWTPDTAEPVQTGERRD